MGTEARQYQVSENEKGQQATNYTEWLTSTAHYPATFEEVCVLASCNLSSHDNKYDVGCGICQSCNLCFG